MAEEMEVVALLEHSPKLSIRSRRCDTQHLERNEVTSRTALVERRIEIAVEEQFSKRLAMITARDAPYHGVECPPPIGSMAEGDDNSYLLPLFEFEMTTEVAPADRSPQPTCTEAETGAVQHHSFHHIPALNFSMTGGDKSQKGIRPFDEAVSAQVHGFFTHLHIHQMNGGRGAEGTSDGTDEGTYIVYQVVCDGISIETPHRVALLYLIYHDFHKGFSLILYKATK